MKREEIKKAAEQNISCNSPLDLGAILEGVGRESFVCGAEWRINSVWHDSNDKPDESPKNKRLIIIEHIADGDSLELLRQPVIGDVRLLLEDPSDLLALIVGQPPLRSADGPPL